MPKKIPELPDIQIRRLRHDITKTGKPCKRQYAVGGVTGLLLQCMPPVGNEKIGSRQWILRATIGDKRKELGLGGYPSIPAKDAREAARKRLADIGSGKDPIAEKRSQVARLRAEQAKEITFEQWTRKAFIPAESAGYKGAAQVRRLNQLLRDYVFPRIGHMYFEDITKQDIKNILDPIMGFKLPQDSIKKETGMRVQRYVDAIMQQAISDGLRDKANPAGWKHNLETSYKHLKKIEVKHQRAITWQELPKFVKALIELYDSAAPRPDAHCFLFLILTVSRNQEARLVDWKEIDLDAKVWHQPKGKYKAQTLDWDIPLSTTAIKILKAQPSFKKQQGRVFSTLNDGEIYDAALSSMPDALGFNAVAHGFRRTFKAWCMEEQVNDDVSELALKHCETASTRAAYADNQLLSHRTRLAPKYEKYVLSLKKWETQR
jgi:integrase